MVLTRPAGFAVIAPLAASMATAPRGLTASDADCYRATEIPLKPRKICPCLPPVAL